MDRALLRKKINRGRAVSARHAGTLYQVFTPLQPDNPLQESLFSIYAVFTAGNGPVFGSLPLLGSAVRQGIFDTSKLSPGDYLCGAKGTFFVTDPEDLSPVLCLACNETVTGLTGASEDISEVNQPSAYYNGTPLKKFFTDWPASLLPVGSGQKPANPLPLEIKPHQFQLLLPVSFGLLRLNLHEGDLIKTASGRHYIIGSVIKSRLAFKAFLSPATL